VLQEGEHGAAVGEAGVGDAAEFQLGGWGDAAEVEGFEGAFGEEEAAVEEGGGFSSGEMVGGWMVGGWMVRGVEETVAGDEAAEGEGGGGGGDGEGEGGVEEGEGAVD